MNLIVEEGLVSFKELEQKIFAYVCEPGREITRVMLESYDKELAEGRDKKVPCYYQRLFCRGLFSHPRRSRLHKRLYHFGGSRIEVIFNVFKDDDYEIYREILG